MDFVDASIAWKNLNGCNFIFFNQSYKEKQTR